MQQNSTPQTESPNRLRDVQSAEITADTSPRDNADVLAKVLLDIKLMLDIEKVLAEELNFETPQKRRPVHDRILTIIHEAGAVSAAEQILRRFRGLRAVK